MEPGRLSSDDNRVCVWRPRGERLNPAFALQRHTTPTAGVMVWGVIAYNTRSPLVLIRGTMTSCNHMCCHSCNGSQEPFSNKTVLSSHSKGVTRLSLYCYYRSLACPIPRSVSNRAYLGSANMEGNISRYHTELVCLNARSYRVVHLR
ncbi:transposable element Tcb1 transposase [Trichonephila clavipes]|nr:transposable element Tcb1 transposase [Trichonephila clavipes]